METTHVHVRLFKQHNNIYFSFVVLVPDKTIYKQIPTEIIPRLFFRKI